MKYDERVLIRKKKRMMRKVKTLIVLALVGLLIILLPVLKGQAETLKNVTAYDFIVDGEKWFTLSDKTAIEGLLNDYQQQYLKNVDVKAQIKNITFKQKVNIVPVEIKPEEINTLENAREKIYAGEQEVSIEIKQGDTLWDLAKAYNLTVEQLEALNPEIDPDKVFPGDKLVVEPFKPNLDVIIEMENTVEESIPFKIETQKDSSLYTNQKKTIREGVDGQKEVTYSITLLNGYQDTLKVKNETIIQEPVNAIVKVGTKTTLKRGSGRSYGIVSGKRISSPYGYRIHPITGRKSFHTGVDIAANSGNGVYAYSDGKVVEAGWNGAYGNSILIDHGNGLKTRYGHLSKIYVRVGQKVGTNDKIGAVGSTGFSTGSHVHFEVLKNGQTKNPLNYI